MGHPTRRLTRLVRNSSPSVPCWGYDDCAMSLLQQDSSRPDDAARGEDLAKGTGHLIITTLIAAIVVTVAVGAYIIAGQKPPAATGQITRVVAHPMHRETASVDASGAPMLKEHFDQVLVFTHLELHNQSKNPLFVRQILTNVTLADGSIRSSYAAIPADYERLFVAYPNLAFLHAKSLPSDATIAPGDSLTGDFVSSFRMTKQEFDARKGLNYNVSFRYLPDLVLTPSVAVAEQ